MGASGTALADAVKYTVMMNMSPTFLRQFAFWAPMCQQYSSKNSFASVVLFFPKIWSDSDHVNRKRQVDSLSKKKTKQKAKASIRARKGIVRPSNTSNADINMCRNFGTKGHWAKDWKPG